MSVSLKKIIAFFLILLSSNANCEQAETGVQLFIDAGLTTFIFDDNTCLLYTSDAADEYNPV